MKFIALALALVFAAGSQAASLPADASQQLAQIRSIMDVYLTQLKDSTIRALEQIEDPALKAQLADRLETVHTQIKVAQAQVAPMTDSAVATAMEVTADIREKIHNDVEALKLKLVPLRSNLDTIVNKHYEEYKEMLNPIINEYSSKHESEMEALRAKLEPVVASLKVKIMENVEETKSALMPILGAVHNTVGGWLESAKAMAEPYVAEYREKMNSYVDVVKGITREDMIALNTKVTPLAQEVGVKLNEIINSVAATFVKA